MLYSTHAWRHLRFIVGRNIHHHRVLNKMTLDELSQQSGVPVWLLDRYELGREELALYHVFRISCALQVEVARMMGG